MKMSIKRANSKQLCNSFPEVYERFFRSSEVVTSAPFSFIWFGDHSCYYGAPVVVSTLPMRAWCGLEPTSDGEVELIDYVEYDRRTNSFTEPITPDDFVRKVVTKEVKSFIQRFASKQKVGFKIRLIFELRTSSGYNAMAAASAALGTALSLYFNFIEPGDLTDWQQTPFTKLVQKSKHNDFDRILRFGWRVVSGYHGGFSSGGSVFAALVGAEQPIVYTTNWRDSAGEGALPINATNNPEVIGEISYWPRRLGDFVGTKKADIIWPIDYCLIFSGETRPEAIAIRSTSAVREDFVSLQSQTKEWFSFIDPKSKDKPYILDLIERTPRNSFWNNVIGTMAIMTLEGISSFEDLLTHGSHEEPIRRFANAINLHHQLLRVVRATSASLQNLASAFREVSYKYNYQLESSAKLVGAGHGGSLLFVSQIGRMREIIPEVVAQQQRVNNPNVSIDYASWVDGKDEVGIRLDQDLRRGIFSQFVTPQTVRITKVDKDAKNVQLTTVDQLPELSANSRMLVDLRDNTIFIEGEQIGSNQLHSSKITAKILRELLLDGGLAKNSLFGSYGDDRNSMQSKIITPINRLIESKFGVKNFLELRGGLTDFTIKFGPQRFAVVFVESVQ